jgi:heat shock protein HslJ
VRFALLFLIVAIWPAYAGEPFPFGSALMLDTVPMPGSKRIPMVEIDDDGTAAIDLWCASLRGQATVGDDSIAIVPGPIQTGMPAAQCEPQRQASDAALLATLAEVTKWRRAGDIVELSGQTTLRFRLMTN